MRAKARTGCWARHPQSEGLLSAALVAPRRYAERLTGGLQLVQMARQFNHECRPASGFTSNSNSAIVIADYGLNDRQPEPRAMRFVGVIRSEQTLALFG